MTRLDYWNVMRNIIISSLLSVIACGYAEEPALRNTHTVDLADFDISAEIPLGPQASLGMQKALETISYERLLHALWMGRPNQVAALLTAGADPNLKSPDGSPILHYAISVGNLERIEDLLKAGADPNQVDQYGRRPLSRPVRDNNRKVLSLLLRYGADPNLKSGDDRSPAEIAKRWHHGLADFLNAKFKAVNSLPTIELPKLLRHPDAVYGSADFTAPDGGGSLVYSSDSRQLITGDGGGAIRFFDAQTGELQKVLTAHQESVFVTMIPNSRVLVSSAEKMVRFWDIESMAELKRLRNMGGSLSVSPDGRFLCTTETLWKIESTAPLRIAPRGRGLGARHRWSFFTPDSQFLVASRESKGIWVWDLERDKLHLLKHLNQKNFRAIKWQDLATVVDIGSANPEDLLGVASDQYTVLSGDPEMLKLLEPAARAAADGPVGVFGGGLASSPDGQFVAGIGHNSRLYVYDFENDQRFHHKGHAAHTMAVAVSPDGHTIASGGNDKKAIVWDRATRRPLAEIPVSDFVYSVAFSPDSQLLAIGDNRGKVYLWENSEKPVRSYSVGGRVTDLAFDPEGEFLASIGYDIHLYDLETGQTRAKISAGEGQSGQLAISPDGKLIVCSTHRVSAGETYKVPPAWIIEGEQLVPAKNLFSMTMGHHSFIRAVAFSPDGSLLAASSNDALRLWDMKNTMPIGKKLCGHTYHLNNAKFSPNGKWLASSSWDGTARVWEVASGRQVIVIDADVARVSEVDFTPDGQLATANWDGTVHLWDLPKHLQP